MGYRFLGLKNYDLQTHPYKTLAFAHCTVIRSMSYAEGSNETEISRSHGQQITKYVESRIQRFRLFSKDTWRRWSLRTLSLPVECCIQISCIRIYCVLQYVPVHTHEHWALGHVENVGEQGSRGRCKSGAAAADISHETTWYLYLVRRRRVQVLLYIIITVSPLANVPTSTK